MKPPTNALQIYVNYQTLPELNVSYVPPWGPESGYNVLPSALSKASSGNMFFLDLETLIIPGNANNATFSVTISSTNPAVPSWLKVDETVPEGYLLSGSVPRVATQDELDNLQQDISVVMTDSQGGQLRFRAPVLVDGFKDGLPQSWTPKPKTAQTTVPPFTSKAIPTTMIAGATQVAKPQKITPPPNGQSSVNGSSEVSTGLSTGAIVGIAVGCMASVGLIAGALIYSKRKRTPPPSLGMYGEGYYTSSRKQDPEAGFGKPKTVAEVTKTVSVASQYDKVPPINTKALPALKIKIDTPLDLNMAAMEDFKIETQDLSATARIAFYQSIPIPATDLPGDLVYGTKQGGPKLPTWCHLSAGSDGTALVLWGMPSEIDVTDVAELVELTRRPRGMAGVNEEVVARVKLTVNPASLSKQTSMKSVRSTSQMSMPSSQPASRSASNVDKSSSPEPEF
jgi:hypothetical protein